MKFRQAIDEISGLRHVAERLELRSGLARRVLYDTPMMAARADIEHELVLMERTVAMLANEAQTDAFSTIALKLEQVKDLRGTVAKLAARRTLDDVELFEVKVFAMTAQAVMAIASMDMVEMPDTGDVVALLDPDGTGIPHFSIYDAYSPALGDVRRKIKKLKQKGAEDDKIADLYAENERIEDEVRTKLSADLAAFAGVLEQAMTALARLDILTAKARQSLAMGLCRPQVAAGETKYEGLFNPVVREMLHSRGKNFQPVDIRIGNAPTVITGANMGGKTVLLKSVALAQAMFQFGFYVPAARAEIVPVDEILTSIGDAQNEQSGLSSFAAEMVRMNDIIGRVRAGQQTLVLIDEPARTTNPVEGEAIVNALLDFLVAHRVRSLVTSHYGGIRADVRKLKVRGLAQDTENVTVANIQDHMDYSLTPDDGQAPREALRIAQILGVDGELTDRAAEYLKKQDN